MVDTEAISPGAKPGVFSSIWVTVPPHVAKPDLLDRIHVMRCPIDSSDLVEICATSIKVAHRQCPVSALRGESSDQRSPIRDLRKQARHIDADQPECGEIDTDHPIGLG